jgi:hypothetical protein
MNDEIPRYPSKKLSAKITLCVEPELKEFWDESVSVERFQLPEEIRKILRKIRVQITEQKKSEG